jgi:phosphoribosylanthranilate isomerase
MYIGYFPETKHKRIQVKICGITAVEDALACAAWGADAVGLVFYPKSPRFVTLDQAAKISSVLPLHVARVGVFVNESFDTLMHAAAACRLSAVQLHGRETPELAQKLRENDIFVIKCLYINGMPGIDAAGEYHAPAFLVECSSGKLPGGNAKTWDWSAARGFAQTHPTIIAGGLDPQNVAEAIGRAAPDAVDVSSGVEAAPGRKDARKVRDFIYAVRLCKPDNPTRRIV